MTSVQREQNPNCRLSGDAKPSLIINAISNWCALCVNLIIGFLLTPYIIKCLGTARYGIWTLVFSVIGYYGLLEMGVTAAVMRYVARYAGRKDYKALNEVVNTALTIFGAVGGIVIIVSIFAAGPLARFFNIEAGDQVLFKQVVYLLGVTTAFTFTHTVLAVIILAHERFVIGNTVRAVVTALRGMLSFVVLAYGGGLVGLGWVYGSVAALTIVANLLMINLCFKHIKIHIGVFKWNSAQALFSFGFFSFIIKIGMLLRPKLGALIIGRCLDMNLVGVYGVAALLLRYLAGLNIACSGVTQPRLASIAGKDYGSCLARQTFKYSVFVSTFAAGAGLAALLLGKDFLRLWLPENFKDINVATMTYYILLVGLVPDLMTNVSLNALEAVNKHRYYAYQTTIGLVASIIFSLLLISRFGVYGVAMGIAIPGILEKFVVQPLYCCKILKIKWPRYMSGILLRPLLVAACIAAFLNVTGVLHTALSYSHLILNGIIIMSLYSVISYFVCFDKPCRQQIVAKLETVLSLITALLCGKQAIAGDRSTTGPET